MRVAALLPAATDIVLALGGGEQLVAVTHACSLPGRLAGIPRVTRSRVEGAAASTIDAQVSDLSGAGAPLFDLDEATLAAQRPDVILTQAVCEVCAVREQDARAAASRMSPPPHVATLGANSVEGILDDCLTVARALDIPEEGEELVAGLRSRIANVHRTLKANKSPRPGVIVLEWTDPLFTAGHWVPDMVRRAGAVELMSNAGEASRRFTVDELHGRDPEFVVVAPCGYGLDQALAEARNFAATWSSPVWVLDANRLTSSPGPGVIRGIEVLSRIFHPTLFGKPGPGDAVAVTS